MRDVFVCELCQTPKSPTTLTNETGQILVDLNAVRAGARPRGLKKNPKFLSDVEARRLFQDGDGAALLYVARIGNRAVLLRAESDPSGHYAVQVPGTYLAALTALLGARFTVHGPEVPIQGDILFVQKDGRTVAAMGTLREPVAAASVRKAIALRDRARIEATKRVRAALKGVPRAVQQQILDDLRFDLRAVNPRP